MLRTSRRDRIGIVSVAGDATLERRRRDRRSSPEIYGTLLGAERDVRRRAGPAARGSLGYSHADTRGGQEVELREVTTVSAVGVVIALLSRREVAQIAAHGGKKRLAFRRRELWNRDRSENADDHDNDEQLDESKTRLPTIGHMLLHREFAIVRGEIPSKRNAPLSPHT